MQSIISVRSISFTSVRLWKQHVVVVGLPIRLRFLLVFELIFVSSRGPETHHPNLVFNANGPLFLLDMVLCGSSAFGQSLPISNPTLITCPDEGRNLTIGSRCFQQDTLSLVGMSSSSTGILDWLYVRGSGIQMVSLNVGDTTRPSMALHLSVRSPWIVFTDIVVSRPVTSRSCSTSSSMNVPWLPVSSSAKVSTLELQSFLRDIFTRTIHRPIDASTFELTHPFVTDFALSDSSSLDVLSSSSFW